MGLLSNIFKRNSDKRLEGNWMSDLQDQTTKESIGNVTVTFTGDGKLIYEVMEGEKLQRMNMTYHTKNNIIISNQPSSPRRENTKYTFEDENVLILEFEGEVTKFKRNFKTKTPG